MAADTKEIQGIKIIKTLEKKHYKKAEWCKDHNMELQRQWHWSMVEELRKLSSQMEDHFDTGYIHFKWED